MAKRAIPELVQFTNGTGNGHGRSRGMAIVEAYRPMTTVTGSEGGPSGWPAPSRAVTVTS
jgi:hypothetical protein